MGWVSVRDAKGAAILVCKPAAASAAVAKTAVLATVPSLSTTVVAETAAKDKTTAAAEATTALMAAADDDEEEVTTTAATAAAEREVTTAAAAATAAEEEAPTVTAVEEEAGAAATVATTVAAAASYEVGRAAGWVLRIQKSAAVEQEKNRQARLGDPSIHTNLAGTTAAAMAALPAVVVSRVRHFSRAHNICKGVGSVVCVNSQDRCSGKSRKSRGPYVVRFDGGEVCEYDVESFGRLFSVLAQPRPQAMEGAQEDETDVRKVATAGQRPHSSFACDIPHREDETIRPTSTGKGALGKGSKRKAEEQVDGAFLHSCSHAYGNVYGRVHAGHPARHWRALGDIKCV